MCTLSHRLKRVKFITLFKSLVVYHAVKMHAKFIPLFKTHLKFITLFKTNAKFFTLFKTCKVYQTRPALKENFLQIGFELLTNHSKH